eukprot:10295097-Heterocapsa_arctica.AAC.1
MSRSPIKCWTPPTVRMLMMSVVSAPASLLIIPLNVYMTGTQQWTTTLNNTACSKTCINGNCS